MQRGFETYARDLFDAFREQGSIDVTLVKGGGASGNGERRIRSLHRDGKLNAAICSFMGRSRRYVLEYASFCAAMLPTLIASPPDVIYALELPVYKFLVALRRRTRARWRLVHFTGGQLARPVPADASTFLHHVTPCSLDSAHAAVFGSTRQFVLPHFLDLRAIPQPADACRRTAIRSRLGLPVDRRIVLSVGSLDAGPKRMDYVVREVAAVEPRPFLVLLGQRDPDTPRLTALADSLLGPDGYRIATVPRDEIWDWYAAADVFALASMAEGFGLVYLEALAAGLPVLAHDFDVARFVLGQEGVFADLSRPGALAGALSTLLRRTDEDAAARRRAYVRDRFDWSVLGPEYARMFREIANV